MELKKYLSGRVAYYVEDCFSCEKNDVEYLFFLESPHNDEIDSLIPLAGASGIAVSQFLFGNNESTPFGQLISEQKTQFKIGIINISNVPLQYCKAIPESDFPVEISKLRTSSNINDTLYNIFKKKMDTYNFPNLKWIIVCGEFASMYFEQYNKSKKTPWENDIILKVPHPSRGQWNFIRNNKDSLDELANLFGETSESTK